MSQTAPSARSAPTTKTQDAPSKKRAARRPSVRRAKMTISRIDPWSALKISFLLSIGLGIMIVISTAILWTVLDKMHVFANIQDLLETLGSDAFLELLQYLEFGRVLSFSVIVGVIDVVLFTFLGWVFALLYNAIAIVVGGQHITVTDE